MRIISLAEIEPHLADKAGIITTIKDAFIAHSQGQVTMPDPVQLLFETDENVLNGDCHVKTAKASGFPFFSVKVATGFYDNPAKNLPVNNGLIMLFSAETGEPAILLQDEGHLTMVRTAAAGALAAGLKSSAEPQRLGIIGTGAQAELQARWISEHMDISSVSIWGRNHSKAERLKSRLSPYNVNVMETVSDLCAASDIIVTTTPATSPLLMAADIRPGHHIVALGADSPGKIELDPQLFAKADFVLADDISQCIHHGDIGHAIKAGLISETDITSLGKALSGDVELNKTSISVVDLTGLGVQDLAIASKIYTDILA